MRQRGDSEFIDLLSNVRTRDTQPLDYYSNPRLSNHNHPTTHKMPFKFLMKMQMRKDIIKKCYIQLKEIFSQYTSQRPIPKKHSWSENY